MHEYVTFVWQIGTLLLQQTGTASQTGTGPVNVNAGTLGGNGTVGGNLNVGNGSGPSATLAPDSVAPEILDFTVNKKLTIKGDGDVVMQVNTDTLTADQVTAKGVTIQVGSTFNLSDLGNTALQQPTTFVLINNTSQGPIQGTFSNIAEGQQIQIGPNKYTFSHHGGINGNDFVGDAAGGIVP